MARKGKPKVRVPDQFNVDEILKNAVISIQLGVEDFVTSRDKPEQAARALSAARNIYAGVLLLFKYKIASLAATPEEAKALIYIPDAVLPHITGSGAIAWSPTPHPRNTINTNGIEARLKSLGIYHDWAALRPLRDCRNALEHLHPTHPVSGIQASIAALFPMLSKFITHELDELPGALLGDAWHTMLDTHDFFKSCQAQIHQEWTDLQYPLAAIEFMRDCRCRACYSSLLRPLQEDVDNAVSIDTSDFRLQCYACGQVEYVIPYLEGNFSDLHEDPFNQSDPEIIQECRLCLVLMYLITDSSCHWCGQETQWPKCVTCEQPVPEHITNAGGRICDRCAEDDWRYGQQ
ncbi:MULTISPECIES: hypothetical protein [Pseudomonas syringae group]|uniref:Uncharacterized protein n=2 Tax=Pseudomonas amygdali TaxID=47877 RepID=A0A0Q0BP85_PSEAJ|nr:MULTISPECIES: hypothetical protein [Pseudomonas syringae group]KPX70308.1 hypothetical protein ALO35_200220 [Pseudomonas amygdali pv. lachrymans]AQX41756.1 hypothetical protein [Pseudomonas amygdali pv. tabaci]KPY80041.1 hypothetical protein ALO60_200009 [Pseudomonas amygdali pv. tabaci]RML83518.1 hypothetical protein ALQ89_200092 [Pseudomonas amygdali pv. tabaci]RMR85682.1 hypothetical protein ALP77_200084 [Pseudomonas amygdali pv. tabaci]